MSTTPKTAQALGCIGWMVLIFAAAALGAMGSVSARGFYESLVRPAWAPPGWLFGPVWTTLYILMAIAACLIWRERERRSTKMALLLYVAQLVLNALWSWLFFAWHQGAWASAEVVLLLLLVLLTVVTFWRVRPIAGMLLIPYLAWVGFATVLCFTIWRLNPNAL